MKCSCVSCDFAASVLDINLDKMNITDLVHKFILRIFIKPYMFWVPMCPSSGETTVFLRHLVLVIVK